MAPLCVCVCVCVWEGGREGRRGRRWWGKIQEIRKKERNGRRKRGAGRRRKEGEVNIHNTREVES